MVSVPPGGLPNPLSLKVCQQGVTQPQENRWDTDQSETAARLESEQDRRTEAGDTYQTWLSTEAGAGIVGLVGLRSLGMVLSFSPTMATLGLAAIGPDVARTGLFRR